MIKLYDPRKNYASSDDISLGSILIEEWKCELVEPNHPQLHRRASTNPFGSDIDWVKREAEMLALMRHNMGIGLAANQIGSSYNMFVMHHSVLGEMGVYKPEIIEVSGREVMMDEGCLTWPLLYLHRRRPEKILVHYWKNDGETQIETWMDGMDARCFLHEYDHLQGILYIDGMSDLKLRLAMDKREKLFRKLERKVKRAR